MNNITEATAVRFAQSSNWVNIAYPGVCLALNRIVEQSHSRLIDLLTKALSPQIDDPGAFVSKVDEEDPDQIWISYILYAVATKKD